MPFPVPSDEWNAAAEKVWLRAWLETVTPEDRTPWLVFAMGAARYRLVSLELLREQYKRVNELRRDVQHLEGLVAKLRPDANRWGREQSRWHARAFELEQLLEQHGIPVPPRQPPPDDGEGERRNLPEMG